MIDELGWWFFLFNTIDLLSDARTYNKYYIYIPRQDHNVETASTCNDSFLTLKGSCVQTLGQTKKASHFEVDLETKQKERSPSCQKRNSCETANHFYEYHAFFKC